MGPMHDGPDELANGGSPIEPRPFLCLEGSGLDPVASAVDHRAQPETENEIRVNATDAHGLDGGRRTGRPWGFPTMNPKLQQ